MAIPTPIHSIPAAIPIPHCSYSFSTLRLFLFLFRLFLLLFIPCVAAYGRLWRPTAPCGGLRPLVAAYGRLLFLVAAYGRLQFLVAAYGRLWRPTAAYYSLLRYLYLLFRKFATLGEDTRIQAWFTSSKLRPGFDCDRKSWRKENRTTRPTETPTDQRTLPPTRSVSVGVVNGIGT